MASVMACAYPDRVRKAAEVAGTMYKAATIADWELDLLRCIENVVRLGHVRRIERDEDHHVECIAAEQIPDGKVVGTQAQRGK